MVCSVFGVQFSDHDQQHSVGPGTGPGLACLPACLCPVVKCVIRGSKGGYCEGGEGRGDMCKFRLCQDTGRELTC